MNANKQHLQQILRKLHILNLVDTMRFLSQALALFPKNRRFKTSNPDIPLPPLKLLYEIGGIIDLEKYYLPGRETANYLFAKIAPYLTTKSQLRVLDWGCGVSRVVRHVPELLDSASTIYGMDVNQKMITWNKLNIDEVSFFHNGIFPPTPLDSSSIDIAYGLSVITHLGEDALNQWLSEFERIIKPGGILLLTSVGSAVADILPADEQKEFNQYGRVIRGKMQEGLKMYLAFHHPNYLTKIFKPNWEILEYQAEAMIYSRQDIWILKKKGESEV